MLELSPADIGFADEVTVDLSVTHLARLAATLDVEPLTDGDALPLLWHWAAFTPRVQTSDLAPDGHPPVPTSLIAYPRRMWGAGTVRLERALRAGSAATRHSTVLDVKEVPGRSGNLVIATVEHRYTQLGEPRIVEQQTLVYREQGAPTQMPAPVEVPTPTTGWHHTVRADELLMFRYCAVTFNSHRIHYDATYAREVEGYPALVFPGPLSALLLAREATHHAQTPLVELTFRATAPLFGDTTFLLAGDVVDGLGSAQILRNDGTVAMEASYRTGDA